MNSLNIIPCRSTCLHACDRADDAICFGWQGLINGEKLDMEKATDLLFMLRHTDNLQVRGHHDES